MFLIWFSVKIMKLAMAKGRMHSVMVIVRTWIVKLPRGMEYSKNSSIHLWEEASE